MNDCILWTGLKWAQNRYGKDIIDGKSMTAHRAAWIRKHGKIDEKLVVCHVCDNGLCVNVNHLFLGTQKENMQDALKKGRLKNLFTDQKGEKNKNSKPRYNERNNKIKTDRASGMTWAQLSEKYNIKSNGHLSVILRSA